MWVILIKYILKSLFVVDHGSNSQIESKKRMLGETGIENPLYLFEAEDVMRIPSQDPRKSEGRLHAEASNVNHLK